MRGRGGQQVGGGFGTQIQLGVRTTKTVKSVGCSNLKDLLENEKLIVEDFDLISELSSFISRKNSYQAEEGSHDDLVMCSVLFGWLTRQTYFKDLTDMDIRTKIYNERIKLLEDNALNFVLIDDGQPEPDVFDLSDDRSSQFDPNTSNRFGGF